MKLPVKYLADWLIRRAKKTPFSHLDGYMNRWWLFNPYQDSNGDKIKQNWLMRWLPSIRVHHILRADLDRHLHDHPWNARSIILKGWYIEEREDKAFFSFVFNAPALERFRRSAGDTAKLKFGEYHRITEVSPGGVYTLFITFGYQGTWGFKVDGKKVPWREYFKNSGT